MDSQLGGRAAPECLSPAQEHSLIEALDPNLFNSVLALLPADGRRLDVVALSSCSKTLKQQCEAALARAILEGSATFAWVAEKPQALKRVQCALLESRDRMRAPVPIGALDDTGCTMHAWGGALWWSGPRAAAVCAANSAVPGYTYFAFNRESGLLLATQERELLGRSAKDVLEFGARRSGAWVAQIWRTKEKQKKGGRIQKQLVDLHGSKAAAAAAVAEMYYGQTLYQKLKPGSDDHRLAGALASRRPKVLCYWNQRTLRVVPDVASRNGANDNRCIHYALRTGQYRTGKYGDWWYAGVNKCLGFNAVTAAAEWQQLAEGEQPSFPGIAYAANGMSDQDESDEEVADSGTEWVTPPGPS